MEVEMDGKQIVKRGFQVLFWLTLATTCFLFGWAVVKILG